jgi:hypothetical protein
MPTPLKHRWGLNRLRLAPGPAVVPQPGITLRARDGVPVVLERWPP